MRRCNQLLVCAAVLAFATPHLRADTFDDDLATARNLLEDGRQDEAAVKFETLRKTAFDAITNKPEDAHTLYIYGSVCMYGGDDDAAAKAIDRAIAIDPAKGEYQTAKGTLLWFQDKPNDAIPFLKKGTELSPKTADAWRALGSVQLELKDFTGAQDSFQKAADLAPSDAKPLAMVGQTLLAAGKPAEALIIYQKAAAIDPKNIAAQSSIGQLQQTAGHFTEALAAYRKVLELTPADWKTLAKVVQVAEALHLTKDRDLAREKLFTLYKAKKISEPMYCREQMTFENRPVIVFEYFEPAGQEAVYYAFVVIGADGKAERRFSLGTDDGTDAMARATGAIKEGEHMFHLETDLPATATAPAAHGSLGMFKKQPTYEETRAMVVDYLSGKIKLDTGTTKPVGN